MKEEMSAERNLASTKRSKSVRVALQASTRLFVRLLPGISSLWSVICVAPLTRIAFVAFKLFINVLNSASEVLAGEYGM